MHVHKAFRAGFAVIVLGAIFVLAMAHVAVSDPAPAYNCGDRGVSYCIVRYSYPCATESGPRKKPEDAEPCVIQGRFVSCLFPWNDPD